MLVWEGADAQTLVIFYIAVVHAVLLYGSETWFMTLRIGRNLVGFHHQVVRRLMRRIPQRKLDGAWTYPLLEETMSEAGMQEVDTYIAHRQNDVAQFIVTSPIMELFLAAGKRPGDRLLKRWW